MNRKFSHENHRKSKRKWGENPPNFSVHRQSPTSLQPADPLALTHQR